MFQHVQLSRVGNAPDLLLGEPGVVVEGFDHAVQGTAAAFVEQGRNVQGAQRWAVAKTGGFKALAALVGGQRAFCSRAKIAVVGQRLTAALHNAGPARQAALLTSAGQSLLAIRRAAEKAGLLRIVPQIGLRAGWLDDLMTLPGRIATNHGLSVPDLDHNALRDLISPQRPAFVKWDARPGNAMLRPDGTLCWFDWEHCGQRSPFDDAAWLLADEWSPDCPDAEAEILAALAQAGGIAAKEATDRFHAMAVLHSFVRLSLILSRKADKAWWSYENCLKYDKIGVTHLHFSRVCLRGARWVESTALLMPLAGLFAGLAGKIPAE